MAKLSNKAGLRIAKLFNAMNVADLMLTSNLKERLAKEIDSDKFESNRRMWHNHGYKALVELREMNINPCGYSFTKFVEL